MERIPGVPLADIWNSLSWDTKVSCVKDVASIVAQLFEVRYNSIGNLFNAKGSPVDSERTSRDNAAGPDDVVLDRIVSIEFFWDRHSKSDAHRGLFRFK